MTGAQKDYNKTYDGAIRHLVIYCMLFSSLSTWSWCICLLPKLFQLTLILRKNWKTRNDNNLPMSINMKLSSLYDRSISIKNLRNMSRKVNTKSRKSHAKFKLERNTKGIEWIEKPSAPYKVNLLHNKKNTVLMEMKT